MERELIDATDADLVKRAILSDQGAFTHLVQRYQRAVFGVALGSAHCPQDAEDIAQEAFLKAYFGLGRLRDPGKFGPWLCRITHCFAISWYRRKDQQLLYTDNMELLQPSIEPHSVEDWITVKNALLTLSEDLRITLVLRYVADWPNRKIGAFLRVPVGTIESRLSRARARLREEMGMVEDHLRKQTVSNQFAGDIQDLVEKGLAILQQTYVLIDRGHNEQNELHLAKAASLLWQAYQLGAKEPRVVWSLQKLWTNTGHLAQVINLLQDYFEIVDEPDEKFLAGYQIALTYTLQADTGNLNAIRLAVEQHRRCVTELELQVPGWRVLWSFAIGNMVSAWQSTGRIDEWSALSLPVYERVKQLWESRQAEQAGFDVEGRVDVPVEPVDDQNRLQVAHYLRALSTVREEKGQLDEAIKHSLDLLSSYEGEETPEAFRLTVDALGQLLRLYRKAGRPDLKASIEVSLSRIPDQLEAVRKRTSAQDSPTQAELLDEYWHVSYTVCHNIGCFFRWDDQPEMAAGFFERGLTYRDSPLGHYFLAGVLLAGRNDRAGALLHLEKSLADPRSSLIHRIEQLFTGDRYFAKVQDDPEFLNTIRSAVARYQQVGVGA